MVTHYRWRFAQFAVLASLIETLKIQPILAWHGYLHGYWSWNLLSCSSDQISRFQLNLGQDLSSSRPCLLLPNPRTRDCLTAISSAQNVWREVMFGCLALIVSRLTGEEWRQYGAEETDN